MRLSCVLPTIQVSQRSSCSCCLHTAERGRSGRRHTLASSIMESVNTDNIRVLRILNGYAYSSSTYYC